MEALQEAREQEDEDKVQELIMRLYDDESVSGRRGVMDLDNAYDVLRKKE